MKALIIWSSFRSGSHMLRSMLTDKVFFDAGEMAFHDPIRLAQMPMIMEEHPKQIVVANPKFGMGLDLRTRVETVRAIPDVRVLLLHRRDLLAQAASWTFAAANGVAFETAALTKDPVTLHPATEGRFMFQSAIQLRQLRILLEGLPVRELAYEDISVPTVKETVEALLERSIKVTAPSTEKSAPERLEDFVTNLSELKG